MEVVGLETLQEAIALAVKLHAGQYRDGEFHGCRIPYIVHPIEVMKTAWAWGAGDSTTLTAAILHDTLEDTPLRFEELRPLFGDGVAAIVKDLTFEAEAGVTKAEYLKQFADASVPALVIKLADRYCNVKDFLLTKPKYAGKYLEKGAVLVEIARSRSHEISERYGKGTEARVMADYDSLADVLGYRGNGAAHSADPRAVR